MGELGSFTSPSSVSVPLEKGLLPSRELLSRDRLRLLCRRKTVPCRRSSPLMLLLSASLQQARHHVEVSKLMQSQCCDAAISLGVHTKDLLMYSW